jgi:hypothetical protein
MGDRRTTILRCTTVAYVLFAAACGAESTQHGAGGRAGTGGGAGASSEGAGASSGGNFASAGSASDGGAGGIAGSLECPPQRPLFLSDCAPLEGIGCEYVEDCCGIDPSTQTVIARCELGRWVLSGPEPEEACSFCRTHHDDGTACEQPPACREVGCYWTSCYAQPLVEECIEGVWRSQTLCSK